MALNCWYCGESLEADVALGRGIDGTFVPHAQAVAEEEAEQATFKPPIDPNDPRDEHFVRPDRINAWCPACAKRQFDEDENEYSEP